MVESKDFSRRQFLTFGSITAAAGAAMLTGCAPKAASTKEATADTTQPVRTELSIPEASAPTTTAHETDVLVIGCGYAGLNAAAAACDAGKKVLVVEKGHPGYGGLSPWAVNANFFDATYGDDKAKTLQYMMQTNEYLVNQNWLSVWCDESKEYWNRLNQWGLANTYDHATATGYWVDGIFFDSFDTGHDDKRGYFQSVKDVERRHNVEATLTGKGIDYIDHTMIVDLLEDGGRVVGAIGLHVPSATVITIKAKAVVMCTGTGCVKPAGFPVGADTFDGLYIGYKHGLPISGMEFEDYHLAYGDKAGLTMTTAGWAYCENLAPGGPGIHADTTDDKLWGDGYERKTVYNAVWNGLATPDPAKQRVNSGKAASTDPSDIRQGNFTSPEVNWSAPGGAPGMPLHMVAGIFNGWDDIDGKTGLPGLYVAGDGTYASAIGGAGYSGISGLTSSSCSVQGNRAGKAAAAYSDTTNTIELPSATVEQISADLTAPLSVSAGYSPTWVNQQLLNVMAQQSVLFNKSDESLNAALSQILYIKNNYLSKLKANSNHDLRLCQEVIHKVTACEIKVRCGLARKESRGMHYRTDYPYRDDQYLGYFTVTNTDADPMKIDFVNVKDEWKGDLTKSYTERYPSYRYRGEEAAKGLA